jgi:hypothetical protein
MLFTLEFHYGGECSAVAVSDERFKYAANRLQLLMWLLCVCGFELARAHVD